MPDSDREANRFSARAARYARVGADMSAGSPRGSPGARLFGFKGEDASNAAALAQALGGLKGPIMKVAQLLATIPDLVPPEYAAELQKLQSEAPPMGGAFVRRRMQAELGPDWQDRFGSFDLKPAAAASLGQVHRAVAKDGSPLACKLQYPDMQSAVEADLRQLEFAFAIHRRMDPAIDTREIAKEIGERVREELDYAREAKHVALYRRRARRRARGAGADGVAGPLDPSAADARLARGQENPRFQRGVADDPQPALPSPCSRHGGTRSATPPSSMATRISAITPCSRTTGRRGASTSSTMAASASSIRASSAASSISISGLLHDDRARIVHAYETWGFKRLSSELIDILNIWARFIYGPLLEDRVRTIADGVKPVRIRPARGVPSASAH